MVKIEKNTLEFLGHEYQIRLVAQVLTDKKFANNIVDILDPNYFKQESVRLIVQAIKEAKQTEDIIPDFGSLKIRVLENISSDMIRKLVLSHIEEIEKASLHDTEKIQSVALNFCKQHELKKAIKKIDKIIDNGDNYEECETILRKALEHGDNKDDGMDIYENIESVLADDFRKPIRTGIGGLDEAMDGGLSKGELAIILAPFGVGKTTMMTKLASTAFRDGHKVLQIFFEDMPKVIQRKHLACWSGYDLNSLTEHKEDLMKIAQEMEESSKNGKGVLKLKKFSSDGTTIPIIRQYIRKLIATGFRPDIVLLDYIDCVEPSKKFDDVNAGEGSVMRQFEAMLADLDIAGWTAVQGNRSSIKAELVEADQMGGSIKKAQIGHFVVSIAKTLDQKENNTATMAILKSRFGKSGLVFSDILFDNAKVQIDMNQGNNIGRTQVEHKNEKQKSDMNDLRHMMEAASKVVKT